MTNQFWWNFSFGDISDLVTFQFWLHISFGDISVLVIFHFGWRISFRDISMFLFSFFRFVSWPNFLTHLYRPVYLDPSILTHLFWPIYFDPSILTRLFRLIYFNPSCWTHLFGILKLTPQIWRVFRPKQHEFFCVDPFVIEFAASLLGRVSSCSLFFRKYRAGLWSSLHLTHFDPKNWISPLSPSV